MTRKTINTLACTLPKTEVSPAVNEVAKQHIQMKDYPVTKIERLARDRGKA